MDQDNFPDAVEAASMSRVASCNNLMVCGPEGEMVCLEMEYKSYAMLYMRDGIISHANHYKHPHMPRPPTARWIFIPRTNSDRSAWITWWRTYTEMSWGYGTSWRSSPTTG